MEWVFIIPLAIPVLLVTLGFAESKWNDYVEKDLPEWKKSKYSAIRSEGEEEMSKALFDAIKDQMIFQLRKIVHDPDRKLDAGWKRRYDVYKTLYYSSMDEEEIINAIAEMVWNYEVLTKEVYDFDLSLGQQNKAYLGSEDENEYQAYIQGGLKFLDKIDQKKLQMVDRRDRIRRREAGLKEINQRWSTVNEELTRLRNQPINVDAKAAFDKELNS